MGIGSTDYLITSISFANEFQLSRFQSLFDRQKLKKLSQLRKPLKASNKPRYWLMIDRAYLG